jgi:hypothetical protein
MGRSPARFLLAGVACISHLIPGTCASGSLLFAPAPSPAPACFPPLLHGGGAHGRQQASRSLFASGALLARAKRSEGKMPNGVKKENLPTKVCVTCNRPFTW